MANPAKKKQNQDMSKMLDKTAKAFESGASFLASAQSITMMVSGMIEANRAAKQQMRKQQEPTPYQVLGVMDNASDDEVTAIYRTKSKFYHPDKGGDPNIFMAIKTAYERIKKERGM